MTKLGTLLVVGALVLGGCSTLTRTDSTTATMSDADLSHASRAYADEPRERGYDLRDAQM